MVGDRRLAWNPKNPCPVHALSFGVSIWIGHLESAPLPPLIPHLSAQYAHEGFWDLLV